MKFPLLIFAYVLIVFDPSKAVKLPPSLSTVAFTKTIVKLGWEAVEGRLPPSRNRTTVVKQAKILSQVHQLQSIMKASKQIIEATDSKVLMDLITSTRLSNNIERDFDSLLSTIEQIDFYYSELYDYATLGVNPSTLEDFAKNIVSHQSSSIRRLTEKIHKLLVPAAKRSGLLAMMAKNNTILNEQIVYQLEQSPHQFFYNLYSRIALTQLKAYTIMQLSFQLREIYENASFRNDAKLIKATFRKTSRNAAEEMKGILDNLPTHFWKDDPQKYEKDVNYLEVTRVAQGYIVNERILKNGKTCYHNCEQHQEATIGKYFDDPYFRRQRRCSGSMYNCKYLAQSEINVCPAYMNSGRRYDYIETVKEIMGSKITCPNPLYSIESRRDSCPYCVCLCDDSGPLSDRYFSLHQAVSDVGRNRVVTGVRFVKKNKIIHLQVQQGELLPYGAIDSDTLEWVPVNGFKLNDRYIYHKQDYFKIDWKNRAIDLHILPDRDLGNVLLTGVRFKSIDSSVRGSLAHLNLEIRVTRFDFQTGKLYSKQANTWIDNLSTQFSTTNRRTELILGEVDVPTKASRNTPKSEDNQYVMFTHTAYDKDAAQTTVPFIDSQDVVPSVPTPLTGAGLYFKRQEGFGGFLSLKLVTYDFSKHLW